jgi:hypothetical protein
MNQKFNEGDLILTNSAETEFYIETNSSDPHENKNLIELEENEVLTYLNTCGEYNDEFRVLYRGMIGRVYEGNIKI